MQGLETGWGGGGEEVERPRGGELERRRCGGNADGGWAALREHRQQRGGGGGRMSAHPHPHATTSRHAAAQRICKRDFGGVCSKRQAASGAGQTTRDSMTVAQSLKCNRKFKFCLTS